MLVKFTFWKSCKVIATREISTDDPTFEEKAAKAEVFDKTVHQCCRLSPVGKKWSTSPAKFFKWVQNSRTPEAVNV